MSDCTFIACDGCRAEGEVVLPATGAVGPLMCPNCRRVVNIISVAPWRPMLERRVDEFAARQRAGTLGTRKQSLLRTDAAIDRDGLEAELAACLLFCPGQRHRWLQRHGPNRGDDLPRNWTHLPKPVEVKQTRYRDDRRGYLLVRPPRSTPGRMRPEYIDDAIYVLMHGQDCLFTALGWADRTLLLTAGQLNPVPVRPGQRECWGMHWSQLLPLDALVT